MKEPLITASQLAAMPTGTALILVDSQYKFVAHIPFYNEMYDNSGWKAPQCRFKSGKKRFKAFDFKEMVSEIMKKQMEEAGSKLSYEINASTASRPVMPTGDPKNERRVDVSKLFSKIDAKIAELEAAEDAEREKKEADKKYHVLIVDANGNRAKIAKLITDVTGERLGSAAMKLMHYPVDLAFDTKSEAMTFARNVISAGGKVTLRMPQ